MIKITDQTTLKEILADQEALAILANHMGGDAANSPFLGMFKKKTVAELLSMIPVPDMRKKLQAAFDEVNGVTREDDNASGLAATLDRKAPVEIAYVENTNGPTLGYAKNSGVQILEKDGAKFKDLAKDGELHPYEDWRLPVDKRAKDLASRLTTDQLMGLMLHTMHQSVPEPSDSVFGSNTYMGKPYSETDLPASALSDQQIIFLEESLARNILLAVASSSKDAAEWSNRLQAAAESLPMGIPVNISSDPRHGTDSTKEFNAGAAAGDISKWPESLALAASFDPEVVKRFSEVASMEYRAMGITTALSPQIDISTEPRWFRFSGSFSESPELAADLARAYCDGFQTSEKEREIADGWGYDSVNAMVKHWPGGGSGEGGRDAHYPNGKFSVYPGNNFEQHKKPFVDGAFKLDGKTGSASAVMPYYTISYNQDTQNGENVGNSYSRYLINDLLRGEHGFDGLVCTDWGITMDAIGGLGDIVNGKCYGVEDLPMAERFLKIIEAGVDQFGGQGDTGAIKAAYALGVQKHGEAHMRTRLEQSAIRILRNIFRVGLFENPYLDSAESERLVGNTEFMKDGYLAQQKSVVLLKNKNKLLPLAKKTKVYVPEVYTPPCKAWSGEETPGKTELPFDVEAFNRYFTYTNNPAEAEAAICLMHMPNGANLARGFSTDDEKNGGNGFIPISLQYRPYTANAAREVSIAGDTRDILNRSYKGKTVTTDNERDLDTLLETKRRMGNKPVIAWVSMTGPMVVAEFEELADAIVASFGDMPAAVLDVLSGDFEPSGLLPLQIPNGMDTVEQQFEDVPFDMNCHVDSEGSTYDFGYGLNWSGVIQDDRVRKYAHKINNN